MQTALKRQDEDRAVLDDAAANRSRVIAFASLMLARDGARKRYFAERPAMVYGASRAFAASISTASSSVQ
jgi:hypothetical protein